MSLTLESRSAGDHDPAQWQRLKELVADALELPIEARTACVAAACAAAPELLASATAMLAAAAAAADFLETPAVQPASVAPMAPGDRCGPYVIEALVGEGGFAEVYRARQTEPIARLVAVKLIKPGMDSRALLARFAAERRTLGRLEHPGIARILDAGATATGRPFVVVEFVDGVSLQRYAAERSHAVRHLLTLFLQVCDAVAHAHRCLVIHRDLKPDNVMVVGVGEQARAIVIDFGIAKVLDGSAEAFTQAGQFLGTPHYSSPEQRSGTHDDIDTRTDVYALGVVLHELLASPRGTSFGATARDRGYARELGWIVDMATAAERSERYAGVAELAADVRAFQQQRPLRAGPPTIRYRAAVFVRRYRVALAAATLVLGALAAGGIAATVGYWHAEAARAEAEGARGEAAATADYLARLIGESLPARGGREVKVVDLLDASGSLLARAADRPDVAARLHHVVGQAYLALGQFEKAESHLRAAGDSYAARHGELDWRGIEATCDLVATLHRAGRLADARPMLEAVAARAVAARGTAHPRTRVLADMRAKLAFDSGNPAAAEAPLRELLALEEAEGHASGIVATAGNLAQVLLGLRRTDEARTLALRARDLALQTYGLDHPLAFAAVRKLAAVHLASGDHAAMHRELEPVLAPARQRLGASHPDFLGLLSYQAAALQGLGRAEEAEPLLRELVATQATKLGRLHPQAMMTLSNYGILLAGKREFAAAEPILRDAAERFAAARGAQDLESVKARYQHGRVVAALGRHREIAPDLATAVVELERRLPGDSTFLASARQTWLEHLEQLAREHEAAAEFDAAAAIWLTAMEVAERLGRPADRQRAAEARAAALRR